jgi:hypothetical protein
VDKDMITQGQHMTADREVMMTIDQGRMDMGTGVMPNGQSIMSKWSKQDARLWDA